MNRKTSIKLSFQHIQNVTVLGQILETVISFKKCEIYPSITLLIVSSESENFPCIKLSFQYIHNPYQQLKFWNLYCRLVKEM